MGKRGTGARGDAPGVRHKYAWVAGCSAGGGGAQENTPRHHILPVVEQHLGQSGWESVYQSRRERGAQGPRGCWRGGKDEKEGDVGCTIAILARSHPRLGK